MVPRALARGCDGVRRYNPVLEQDRKSSTVSSPAPCCSRGHTSRRHGCGDGRGTRFSVGRQIMGIGLHRHFQRKYRNMKVLFTLRFFCLVLHECPCLVQSVQALAHCSHLGAQTNPLLLLLHFASAAECSGKCGRTGMLVSRSQRALQHLG